ncbi:hypothetical protein BaRGS_00007558 [Batillaria attramentaria]|uniref:Uncharacterized protein n=1 Tax=Batillaria attramentaria TaxID=370345 RepID=A0ABD0LPC6_9CAEN
MGRPALSKSARPRDLADCLASDNHIANEDYGKPSGSGSKSRSPVRLVRLRTLSSERDGGGQGRRSNGRKMSLLGQCGLDLIRSTVVIRNGTGSEHLYLTRLLSDTQPPGRWQEPLKSLLTVYIQCSEAKQAVSFLLANMDTAIRAVQDPDGSLGYPSLYIDVRAKPRTINIDHWKKILLGLHFDLTEPEGNRDIDLIEVKITKYVTLALLSGFKLLLQSLLAMDWDMLRMVLAFNPQEGLELLTVLQNVLMPGEKLQNTQILVNLHSRYPDQLSALGFHLTRSKGTWEAGWRRPDTDHIFHVEVVLLGLYHDGSGLESFI